MSILKDSITGKSISKIFILFFLYLSQGLPFGFQATALPVYLRTQNVSLSHIGFATLLAAPWLFKALWAPLVDRFGSSKIGRRKSWIIPLQILLFISIIFASFCDPQKDLAVLLTAVFFMNLFAATQDIAVDGLAVDLLGPSELGLGNSAQVVGYKTGMLVSGGLLVWMSGFIGWDGLFLTMSLISLLPLPFILFYRETPQPHNHKKTDLDLSKIIRNLINTFRSSDSVMFILFILSYKFGETMVDVMFKPFLVDSGFTASQIGLWVGTWGMGASICGSLAGGLLASRLSIIRALSITLALRVIPLVSEWWLTIIQPSDFSVISVTVAEHFIGGMLTTVMFAFMMSRVNRQIGATHYTVLASLEVLGKFPGAWGSGLIAESIGYFGLFGLGAVLSLLVIFFIPYLRNQNKQEMSKG